MIIGKPEMVATNGFDIEIDGIKYRVVQENLAKYRIYTWKLDGEYWDYFSDIPELVSNEIAREISAIF